jgi:ABC-type transport system involved in multi-copper enzyme maturation permease subunit
MFRALLWKEWRQLALVRWGGVAIGAVLPIAFTAGAELSQRGLLATGTVKAYAPRDLMYELLPAALGFGLWPLIGLMSAAQAFAGDRAAGTEAFLLERPVPRAGVWLARLTASFFTLFAVIAATAVPAAIAAALTGAPPGLGWSRWSVLVSLGLAVGLLALLSGLIAASLLSSPLGAVLLGVLLGGVPVVLAAQLAAAFPYARVGKSVVVGAVVPFLLLPAYLAASWLASCRGEPSGRGRIRRAVTFLGSALAGSLVLFVVLVPVAIRANARAGQHWINAAPSGGGAYIGANVDTAWGGGWLVDTATGAKRVFVPPPVRETAWSPDGSEIAIVTWSGALGSVRDTQRIDIRSAVDGRVLRSIPVPDEHFVYDLTWADGGLVAIASHAGSHKPPQVEVTIVDSITGGWRPSGFRSNGWPMSLVGPVKDRRVFVQMTVYEEHSEGKAPRGHRLHLVDVAAARVGPAMMDASGRVLTFAGWREGLSPGGRFARIIDLEDATGESHIVDLRAMADQPSTEIPPSARWLSRNRLVWADDLGHRKRLFVGTPGARPLALREWRDAQVGVEPSPDGQAVFVSVLSEGVPASDAKHKPPDADLFEVTAPAGDVPEELVYLPEENRFVSLGPPFSDRVNDHRYTQWAGAKTLARIAPGVVCFEDIDAPGKRRFVIGGARDLE